MVAHPPVKTALKTALKTAMILAAGKGTRMMPLTKHIPKAMVEIQGKPLILWIMEKLKAAGVDRLVVNSHYNRAPMHDFLKSQTLFPEVVISEEEELLETGGGLVNALPLLGDAPFYCINCDSLWLDAITPLLARLNHHFNSTTMDALLTLFPLYRLPAETSKGDFLLSPTGLLKRRPSGMIAPFLYTGIQVLHPRLFATAPAGAYSLNVLYNQALEAGTLHGMVHDGAWYHVSTPADVAATDFLLKRTL